MITWVESEYDVDLGRGYNNPQGKPDKDGFIVRESMRFR